MTGVDIALRASAITLIALYVLLTVRDGWKVPAVRYAIIALGSVAALFLHAPGLPVTYLFIVRFIDSTTTALIWWAALAILQEDFRLKWYHWGGLFLTVMTLMPWRLYYLGWSDYPNGYPYLLTDAVTLLLFGHLTWVIVNGYKDDLIDRRRRLRLFMLATIIFAVLLVTLGENVFEAYGKPGLVIPFIAVIVIIINVILFLWTVQMHPEAIKFDPIRQIEEDIPKIRPQDKALHNRLLREMETERAWAEPGLTIGALAERLGIPEHHLRTLINRGMGYRNFASFLNGYRLAYAKSILSDPEQTRLPVLTIAMDAGFGSLAPFNRVFKAAEGITPTAFRAKALADQI